MFLRNCRALLLSFLAIICAISAVDMVASFSLGTTDPTILPAPIRSSSPTTDPIATFERAIFGSVMSIPFSAPRSAVPPIPKPRPVRSDAPPSTVAVTGAPIIVAIPAPIAVTGVAAIVAAFSGILAANQSPILP